MIRMNYKQWLLLAICALLGPMLHAQDFQKILDTPTEYDFDEIKSSAKTYFDKRGRGKGSGFKQYSRWEWFMQGRLNEEGRVHSPKVRNFEEAQKYREFNLSVGRVQSPNGNWIAKGPTSYTTTADGTGPGLGRLNTLCFDPQNGNTIYVGAPDGGLWKSTNNGSSWTSLSDGLANLGVSGIAVHPTSTNIIYILTGDGPGVISTNWPSIHNVGVLKSINGGSTWQSTGLVFNDTNSSRGHRLIMDPSSPNKLLVATSTGIYRTTNSGATWSMTQSGNFRSMEYKPGSPSTVYASNETNLYRSLNGGASWTQISNANFPSIGTRSLIAVSPAQPNWVYLTFTNSSGEFLGLLRSTNSGLNWSVVNAGAVDLLNESPSGGTSGQSIGHYALAMAVSPSNANVIDIAGLNHWRSTNGGSSFSVIATWSTDSTALYNLEYCHGDFHFLQYRGANSLWACNDGGIYRRNNSASGLGWEDRSSGLGITQIYRLGENASGSDPVYLGTQDNGLFKYTGSPTFTHAWIGDVMDVVVNQDNPDIIYAERFRGQLYRSTNGGVTFQATQMSGTTFDWITPLEVDPNNGNTVYTTTRQNIVFRSLDAGASFQQRQMLARPSVDIEVAPSNSNFIFACDESRIWKSTNAAAGWNLVTSSTNLPLSTGAVISDLEIDETVANRIWITVQGYVAGEKVYSSTNGGVTWVDLSAGLPNVPVNAVVHDHGSANGIYVGTDIGVWYRDDNTNGWVEFNQGLPSVVVHDLEINQSTNILKAGTFGRGYWESDLFSADNCPNDLSLSGNVNTSSVFEAKGFIVSSQTITGSQTSVVYNAGDYIELGVGFEAVAGIRSFETQLIGCSSSKAQPISGIYEGPMPGVAIPYELEPSEDLGMNLRLAPNPGNDLVSFIFNLPKDGNVTLAMYSIQGEKVVEIIAGEKYKAGEYRIRHDISDLPNGVYFVKVRNGENEHTEKLVILH